MKDYVSKTPNYEECEPYPDNLLRHDMLGQEFHPDFKPDWTPVEVFALGAFGGAYYTPYPKCLPDYLLAQCGPEALLAREPDPSVNLFGVLGGKPLRHWLQRGWTNPAGPLGFMSWYASYYEGIRTSYDDEWVARWDRMVGPRSLVRMPFTLAHIEERLLYDDTTRFLRTRQVLLQWGVRLDWQRDVKRLEKYPLLYSEHRPLSSASRAAKVRYKGYHMRVNRQKALQRIRQASGIKEHRLKLLLEEMFDAQSFGLTLPKLR